MGKVSEVYSNDERRQKPSSRAKEFLPTNAEVSEVYLMTYDLDRRIFLNFELTFEIKT